MAASTDHLTRLLNIRNKIETELSDECDRRAALTEAGNPPPATYSVGGKSVSWTDYISTMLNLYKLANEHVIAAGGDGDGLYEERMRCYT